MARRPGPWGQPMPWQECDYCGRPFRPRGPGGARFCGPRCNEWNWKMEATEAGLRASLECTSAWEAEARAVRYQRMAEVARANPELPLALLCERFGVAEEDMGKVGRHLWRLGCRFPVDFKLADVPAP